MTTAIRPGNGMNWGEVFPNLADDDPAWDTINSILYNMAAFGRFGLDKPKANGLGEIHILALYRTQAEKMKKIDISKVMTDMKAVKETNPELYDILSYGVLWYLNMVIGNTNPEVGHFLGPNRETNADAFLGEHDGA